MQEVGCSHLYTLLTLSKRYWLVQWNTTSINVRPTFAAEALAHFKDQMLCYWACSKEELYMNIIIRSSLIFLYSVMMEVLVLSDTGTCMCIVKLTGWFINYCFGIRQCKPALDRCGITSHYKFNFGSSFTDSDCIVDEMDCAIARLLWKKQWHIFRSVY